jgi:hypothetical protein
MKYFFSGYISIWLSKIGMLIINLGKDMHQSDFSSTSHDVDRILATVAIC